MRALRVLMIDDLHADALLVVEELRRGGFDVVFERVDRLEQVAASLERRWDAVVSEYAMTDCTALSALGLVRARHLDLPFIIVAKLIGEAATVQLIREGAHDFIVKGDLARLCPAMERELRAVDARRRLAHEINNPLSGLIANLDLVDAEIQRRSELECSAPDRSHFRDIDEPMQAARACADRIRTVVRSFLPADTPRLQPVQNAGIASSGGRVLIVDDEPTLLNVMRRVLSAELEVLTARHGRDAIERIIRGERFDVILCDLMMPDMTGMDVHDELSKSVPEQAARMIFMTGGAFTPRAQQFLEQVRDRCIAKPFELGHLKALVRERLRSGD